MRKLLRQSCQSGAPDQSLVPRCVCAPVETQCMGSNTAFPCMGSNTAMCVCACARVRVCQQVSKKKAQTHLGRAQGGSPQDEEDFGIFEFDSEHARGVFLSEWAASKERGATLMADCGGCSTRNALGQCARADGVAGGGLVRRLHKAGGEGGMRRQGRPVGSKDRQLRVKRMAWPHQGHHEPLNQKLGQQQAMHAYVCTQSLRAFICAAVRLC